MMEVLSHLDGRFAADARAARTPSDERGGRAFSELHHVVDRIPKRIDLSLGPRMDLVVWSYI